MLSLGKLSSAYIPLAIFFAVVFNGPLQYAGIPYLYLVFTFFGIILFVPLISYKVCVSDVKVSLAIIFPILYLISLFFILVLQAIIYGSDFLLLKSFFGYGLFIIYWLMYFTLHDLSDFKDLINKTIPIVFLIVILSFVQFFLSPDIYGLLDSSISRSIRAATESDFDQYKLFFRASSTLGSPQVFGLFVALYIVIISDSISTRNNAFLTILLLTFIFGGAISGNKSFYVILLLLGVIYFFKNIRFRRIFFLGVAFLFLLLHIFDFNHLDLRVVDRVFSLESIIEQENEDSRIRRYFDIVYSSDVLMGDGLGSKSFATPDEKLGAAESYIFQIWYEAGLLVLSFFLLFIFSSIIMGKKFLIGDIRILIFFIFLGMVVVHAFNSPVFFIFWGIIMSAFSKTSSFERKRALSSDNFSSNNTGIALYNSSSSSEPAKPSMLV